MISTCSMISSSECSALYCYNYKSSKRPGKRFFRFPKDEARCWQWVSNCGMIVNETMTPATLNKSYKMCEDHFADNCFTSRDKKKLNWNAVPTIFPTRPPVEDYVSPTTVLKRLQLPPQLLEIQHKKPRIEAEQQNDSESHPDRYPSPYSGHNEQEKTNTAECDRQQEREHNYSVSHPDGNPSPYSEHKEEEKNTVHCDRQQEREHNYAEFHLDRNPSPQPGHNEQEKSKTVQCDRQQEREKEESEKEETEEENAMAEIEQSAEKQGTPASESEYTTKAVGVSDVWLAIKTEQGLSSDDDTALFLLHFYQHHKSQGKSSSRDCVVCGSPVSPLCTACVQRQTQLNRPAVMQIKNASVTESRPTSVTVCRPSVTQIGKTSVTEGRPFVVKVFRRSATQIGNTPMTESRPASVTQIENASVTQNRPNSVTVFRLPVTESRPASVTQIENASVTQSRPTSVTQSRPTLVFRPPVTESRPASVTMFRPLLREIRPASVTHSNSSIEKTGTPVSSAKVQTHNRQPPPTALKCPICERAFNSRSNFQMHVREMHWNSPTSQTAKTIRCQTCKIDFLSLWELKVHRLKEHQAASTSVLDSSLTGEELNEMKKKESGLGGKLMEQEQEEEEDEFDGDGELKEKLKEEFGELMEEFDFDEELKEKVEEEFDGWGEWMDEEEEEEFGGRELNEKKKREAEELSEKKKREAEMYRAPMERKKKKSYGCPIDQIPCDQCGKKVYKKNLQLHKLIVHLGVKPFHCSKCTKSFKSLTKLKNHKKLHGDQGKLKCPVCSKTFTFLKAFESHQQAHERQRLKKESAAGVAERIQCEECGKVVSKSYLLKHKQIHTDQKPHLCPTCGKTFKTYPCLSSHKKTHTTRQRHSCALCNKTLTTLQGLKSHRLVHEPESEKRHVCPTCGRTFKYQRNYSTHRQEFHSSLDRGRFKCEKCGKGFFYESSLKKHLPVHDAGRVRRHRRPSKVRKVQDSTCRECGRKFSAVCNLYRHMKIHSNLKLYMCDLCPKRFNVSDNLNQHRKTHQKSKESKWPSDIWNF